MHRLEFEGLLESRPRSGTRVRIPSREDVKGHYIVREALEVQVAMRVAAVATAHDLDRLRALAERVDALGARSDNLVFTSAHQGFPPRMAEYSRSRSLCDALEQTHAFSVLWLARMRRHTADGSPGCHGQLVEALSSGDPAVAGEAMRRHIALGLERSMQALEPYFRLSATGRRPFRRGRRQPQVPPLG
jgi:DNA-binding GntR family transcriptional regulator